MNTAYALTGAGFIAVTAIFYFWLGRILKRCLAASKIEVGRQKRILGNYIIAISGWAVFLSILSLTGIAGSFDLFPLNLAPVLGIPLIAILLITFSPTTKQILVVTSRATIVQIQSFRVLVELLLWALFVQNLLPVQMTFEGRNFDVLSGLTALLAARLMTGNKTLMILWNLAGLSLLINIVAIAILSMPTPIRAFDNEPVNTIVAQFPFILLPGMLVPLAYGLHFLSLRQLSVDGGK